MITGFLFFSKLIDGKTSQINWLRLYVSRVLRLVPLYLFALFVLAAVTARLSNFTLHENLHLLLKQTIQWMTFTIFGAPDLNGVERTSIVLASVTWSLPFEWFFYFSLPVLALFVRVVPPRFYILASAATMVTSVLWRRPELIHLGAFAGGIAAAIAARAAPIRQHLSGWTGSVAAIAALVAAVFFFSSPTGWTALFLYAAAFVIIACGNNLFGALSAPISRLLGEMSYSIYVLHGALLFVTFKLVIGTERAAAFSIVQYWAVICGCSVALVLGCALTFRLIEAPAMRLVPAVNQWIETVLLLSRRRSPVLGHSDKRPGLVDGS